MAGSETIPLNTETRRRRDIILGHLRAGRRAGPSVRQHCLQRAPNDIVNPPPLAKPNLKLGWMRIYVHRRGIHFQVQQPGRMAAMKHHILVGPADRVRNRAVEYRPSVQEQVLHVSLAARVFRASQPAPQVYAFVLLLEIQGMLDKFGSQQPGKAFLLLRARGRGRQIVAQPPVFLVTH